jgi:hypothetical protein
MQACLEVALQHENKLGAGSPPRHPGLLNDWLSRCAYLGGSRAWWWEVLLGEVAAVPEAGIQMQLPVSDEHPSYDPAPQSGDGERKAADGEPNIDGDHT